MSVRSVSSTYWYVPLQYGYRLPVFWVRMPAFSSHCSCGGPRKAEVRFRLRVSVQQTVLLLLDTSIPTAVIIAASIFLTSFNAGSAYAHYRFSLLCDTNVRQHFYLPITQPASIERCNGDGGKQFARTSVQLKQCFVLSAHLHCSLGLGICIAHWLWVPQNQHHCSRQCCPICS